MQSETFGLPEAYKDFDFSEEYRLLEYEMDTAIEGDFLPIYGHGLLLLALHLDNKERNELISSGLSGTELLKNLSRQSVYPVIEAVRSSERAQQRFNAGTLGKESRSDRILGLKLDDLPGANEIRGVLAALNPLILDYENIDPLFFSQHTSIKQFNLYIRDLFIDRTGFKPDSPEYQLSLLSRISFSVRAKIMGMIFDSIKDAKGLEPVRSTVPRLELKQNIINNLLFGIGGGFDPNKIKGTEYKRGTVRAINDTMTLVTQKIGINDVDCVVECVKAVTFLRTANKKSRERLRDISNMALPILQAVRAGDCLEARSRLESLANQRPELFPYTSLNWLGMTDKFVRNKK